LTLGFPGRTLCRGLSFAIAPGQCWAVLGNNGSGKTTLMHALAGIRKPLAGTVHADDALLARLGAAARAQRIGLLLQEEPTEFWGSVLDYVVLGRYPHRRSMLGREPEAERLARGHLERMDLGALAGRSLATLSGGERQRARLALVLTQDPVVYLLDEPLQHLDLRHQLQALDCFTALAQTAGRQHRSPPLRPRRIAIRRREPASGARGAGPHLAQPGTPVRGAASPIMGHPARLPAQHPGPGRAGSHTIRKALGDQSSVNGSRALAGGCKRGWMADLLPDGTE